MNEGAVGGRSHIIGINLPEQMVPVERKRAKVMLSVWVIVLGEIIELRNSLDQRLSWHIKLL